MSATAPALVFPPPAGLLPGGIDGNQLLQSLPLPVLALDPEDRIRFVNAAAAQFLGVAPLGRLLQDFFPADCPLFTLARPGPRPRGQRRRPRDGGGNAAPSDTASSPSMWRRSPIARAGCR